jgi:hypothetical protein
MSDGGSTGQAVDQVRDQQRFLPALDVGRVVNTGAVTGAGATGLSRGIGALSPSIGACRRLPKDAAKAICTLGLERWASSGFVVRCTEVVARPYGDRRRQHNQRGLNRLWMKSVSVGGLIKRDFHDLAKRLHTQASAKPSPSVGNIDLG